MVKRSPLDLFLVELGRAILIDNHKVMGTEGPSEYDLSKFTVHKEAGERWRSEHREMVQQLSKVASRSLNCADPMAAMFSDLQSNFRQLDEFLSKVHPRGFLQSYIANALQTRDSNKITEMLTVLKEFGELT